MDKFRVIVSSVFPSDLMAVLIARTCEERVKIELEVNESFDLGSSAHRQYVSRAALPLLDWKFCEDGIWRQKFVPLDGLDDHDVVKAVNATVASYQEEFCVDESTKIEFKQVADRAIHEFNSVPTTSGQSAWARITSTLLTCIFDLYDIDVDTLSGFSKARKDGLQANDLHAICDHIQKEMSRKSLLEARLSFGGQIVLRERNAEAEQKLDRVEMHGESIVFIGLSGEYAARDLSEKVEKNELAIFLRGPVQMVLSKPAIHLPWYAKGFFIELDSADADGVEFLSPMVVYDELRSLANSSTAKRLKPTGYSLIEYSSPAVAAACRSLLGSNVNHEDLEDWREMVSLFPASREKLSKRQGRLVVPLISKFRRRARCELDDGRLVGSVSGYNGGNTSVPISLLGWNLIYTVELLKFVCDCSNSYSPRVVTDSGLDRLSDFGFVDQEGAVQMAAFSDHFAKIFDQICGSLISWGISEQALESRFSSCLQELRDVSTFKLDVREKVELPKSFRKAVKNTDLYSQHLLEEYYKFASFFCASVLKAHPLVFCATHTKACGAEVLRELIKQRKGIPFHPFKLEVLDAI
ncbi:hypothetical protein C8N43_1486 [Litoreibacter ponti]|uniref:Uncharacterized protein n=1 Tax=Litoreibacter ponti TaxID=1510457 RepID=A0A2T6BL87_9RHOB|nr:hypothetical protein [Litoreibacter ponti]PTX56821.1 hypothetical protein C8N43_1486 [Litoreibacter ponti]